MSLQQQIKACLEKIGIPYKSIEVYGSQIVITAWSEDAAIKWGHVLVKFAQVRKVALKTVDYAKENKGTTLCPTVLNVYRTYATI